MREERTGRPHSNVVQVVPANRPAHRSTKGAERRAELLRFLQTADGPVLGAELAQRFNVSRQVLVQDMALLRAAGEDIIATPRGYLFRNPDSARRAVVHIQHDGSAEADEMTILVDLGIHIVDIAIDHPVYGPLCASLNIASRRDVQDHMAQLAQAGAATLAALTGGRHSHTVEIARPDALEQARAELRARGYLAE